NTSCCVPNSMVVSSVTAVRLAPLRVTRTGILTGMASGKNSASRATHKSSADKDAGFILCCRFAPTRLLVPNERASPVKIKQEQVQRQGPPKLLISGNMDGLNPAFGGSGRLRMTHCLMLWSLRSAWKAER